jgi:hypothetical protein
VDSGLVIDDTVPLRWRALGRAYDFIVMALGVWFLVSHGRWLPWTTFVVANLASLQLEHSRNKRPLEFRPPRDITSGTAPFGASRHPDRLRERREAGGVRFHAQ